MSLHQRLKELRKELGYTQEQMGELCGIKKSAYSMIENGHSHLTKRNKQLLLDTLNLSESWLDEGEGEKFNSKRAVFENTDIKLKTAKKEFKMVPVINIDSIGDSSPFDSVGSILRYVPFQSVENDDIAAVMAGDSMAPAIPAGAIILLRPVTGWRTFLEFGQTYLLVLKDGRRIVRMIRKSEGKRQTGFLLKCLNEESDTMEIPSEMISSLYIVRAVFYETAM